MPQTVALAVIAAGGGAAFVAAAVRAAESVPSPDSVAPYIGGGAGAVAVAALAEVTRRLLNGRLIPRETKDVEEEIGAAIVAAGEREARLIALVVEERQARTGAQRDTADRFDRLERQLRDNAERLERLLSRER